MYGSTSQSFEQAIRLMDPLLSVRSSTQFAGKWVIERKGYIPEHEKWFLKRRADRGFRIARSKVPGTKVYEDALNVGRQCAEEFRSAQDGKRVIMFVDNLDRRVFDMLALGDVQRFGGYSRFLDEVEKTEKAKEDQLSRELANMREDTSKEVYDRLQFAWDHKIDKLLRGENPWN